MDNTILDVKNIEKKFKNNTIIDDISFSVKKGDIFGFLGPNGAGKTTAIKIILNLINADKGEVLIDGKSIDNNSNSYLSKIGALVEGPAFYEYMTAEENLEIFGAYSGGVNKEKIHEILKLVGLEDRGMDKVKEYSLGMKQRLGIAQALLNNPELLILDEPINGLDPQGIKEVRKIICDLSKKGVTILLSSHILSEVEQICNKVLIINKGKTLAYGETKDLIKNSNIYDIESTDNNKLIKEIQLTENVSVDSIGKVIRVKIDENLAPEDLLIRLINKGIKIKSYIPIKLTLEEYFFEVMEEI